MADTYRVSVRTLDWTISRATQWPSSGDLGGVGGRALVHDVRLADSTEGSFIEIVLFQQGLENERALRLILSGVLTGLGASIAATPLVAGLQSLVSRLWH